MRKIGLLGLSIWILGLCVSIIAAAEHRWHLLTASNALRLTASEPQSGTLTYLDTIDRAFQETDWEPTSEGYQLIIPCPRTGLYQWNDQRIVAGITPGVTLHGTPVYVNGQEAIYTEKVMMEAFVLPGEDFAFAKAPLLSHAFAQGTYYYYEIAEEGDYHYTYGEETYHFYLDLSEPEVIMTPDLNDLELVFFQDNRYLYKESGPHPQGTLTLFWQDPVLAAFGYPEGCYETTIQLEEGVNDPAEVLPFGYLDLPVFEVDTEAPQIVDWQEGTTYVSQVNQPTISEANLDREASYLKVNGIDYLGQPLPQQDLYADVYLVDLAGHTYAGQFDIILDDMAPTYVWQDDHLSIEEANLAEYQWEATLDGRSLDLSAGQSLGEEEGILELKGWIRDRAGHVTPIDEAFALDLLAPRIDYLQEGGSLTVQIEDRFLKDQKISLTRSGKPISQVRPNVYDLEDGFYELEAWASDQSGHTSHFAQTLCVDTQAPILTPAQWQAIYTDDEVYLNWQIEDLHSVKGEWRLYQDERDIAAGMLEKAGWTMTLPDGQYHLDLVLWDELGQQSFYQHRFQVRSSPPVITLLVDGVTLSSTRPLSLATGIEIEMESDASLAWRIYKDSLPVSEGSDPTIQLARQDGIYQLEVEATDEVGRTTSKRLTIVMEGTEAMDLTQWKNAFRLAPKHATHTELAIMGVIIIALMCIGWLVFRRNRVRSQKASRAASEKTAKLL